MTGLCKKPGLICEYLGVALIFFSVVKCATFLISMGALPPPFFHVTNDTFMDWYNTAYWANHKGAYTSTFSTIYPPLSFVFLKIVSIHSCYFSDSAATRDCDWLGRVVLIGCYFVAVCLTYMSLLKVHKITALPRSAAIALGMPMLYALERGQLLLPCFCCFILGYSTILKSARLRWIFVALAINFKPYLIINTLSFLSQRRWRAFEGVCISGLLVYLITYAILGEGSPVQIFHNMVGFAELNTGTLFDFSLYSSTYNDLILLLESPFPVMHFIGSRPMETLEWWVPLLKSAGEVGVLICFVGSLWLKRRLSLNMVLLLSTVAVLSDTNSGGYAELFLIYLAFRERMTEWCRTAAILICYVLSVCIDFPLVTVAHQIQLSWITNRVVGMDLSVQLGEVVRPGLVLIVEYLLIIAALRDLHRAGACMAPRESDLSTQAVAV